MATNRSTLSEVLEPWVTEIFFNNYTREPLIYPQWIKQVPSSKAFEDKFKVAGLGTFNLKPEGTPIAYDEPVQGPRKRVTHSTYALGFRVTEEMQDDDQHNIVGQMPADLSDSARDHQEQIAHQLLNTAFVDTSFTTQDGQALCASDHVLLRTGETASNVQTPGVDLSHTGFEAMLTQIRLTMNDTGRPIVLNPKCVIYHPEQEWEAQRILDSEYEPGTNENQINTMKNSRTGLEAKSSRYLTNTRNWFIISNEHHLTWYDRKPLALDNSSDAQTKDKLFDARYRASVVPWDWFGVNGSAP
jgi:hypothetical protein